MGKGSTYTDEQKAEYVALVREVGLAEAARRSGVSKTSLYYMARRAGVEFDPTQTANATAEMQERRDLLREELRTKMLEKASDLLDRMDGEVVDYKGQLATRVVYDQPPSASVKDHAIAFAVLLDKYRLEVGEATGRTESVSLTDGLDPEQKRELRERLARSVRGELDSDGAGGAADRAGAGVDPAAAPGPA